MGLLDGLLGLYVADRIMTYVIFCIMGIILIGLLIGLTVFDMNTGGGDDASKESTGVHDYKVKITTNGEWEGSVSSDDVKMEDISGTGDKTIDLGKSDASNVKVDISKTDDSAKKLTVKLYSDGKVVDKDTVDEPSESAMISA